MADVEVVVPDMTANLHMRCPRCRAVLDLSGQKPGVKFRCGGCSWVTDLGACIAATELIKLPLGFRLAAVFVPPAFMGGFFTFVTSLPATGFALWWESIKVAMLGGFIVAAISMALGSVVLNREIPKIGAKLALAGITLGLAPWLRWQAGMAAVSDTGLNVLNIVALIWLLLAIVQIFSIFRAPAANAVARVVEVDNLAP